MCSLLLNIKTSLFAWLYLSHTVWFCYSFLSITSFVLKRYHWESKFFSVDPTLVAIAAATSVGPFTYLLAHSKFLKLFRGFLMCLLTPLFLSG
ncbi:hypothetical protein THRCLA_21997 [Thraustotheca clavata]|uniref:Uncharacterized protein n=1 Tax=Thraustotheca clavata TaxID=74557 RepID=A0A1V9ZES5_9STRA|nr:hypothetical protein THRCLA_21997 [Thraustotheca clavata]